MKYKGKVKNITELIKSFHEKETFTKDSVLALLSWADKEIEVVKNKDLFFCDIVTFRKEFFEKLEEIKDNEVWKPEMGERYFHIRNTGECSEAYNENSDTDKKFIKTFNIFKTFEQSEQVEKAQKLLRAQMAWKFQNDDVELNFKSDYIKKFFIKYNREDNKFEIGYSWRIENLNLVYFSSEEKAKQCLEFLKKEGLL